MPNGGEVRHDKSLQRVGGSWCLVCQSLAGIDKVPIISRGELPGAESSRQAALIACSGHEIENAPIAALGDDLEFKSSCYRQEDNFAWAHSAFGTG